MSIGPASPSFARTAAPRALKGLFFVALVFLLKAAQALLIPVLVAVIFTFVLSPAVRLLSRRGIHEGIGAALVVAAVVGSIVWIGSTVASPAADWWERAPYNAQQLAETIDRARRAVPLLSPPPAPPKSAARQRNEPAPPDAVKEKIATESVALTGNVLIGLAGAGMAAAATIILTYFLLASERWLVSRTLEAIPGKRARVAVLGAVRAAQRDIAAFLATQALINCGLGIATGLAMWALGMPSPVLWGAIAGLLNFIPYLGPLATLVVLLIAGVITFPTVGEMAAPALAFAALNVIESSFVTPWVVGRRLELSPVAVFLTVMVGGWLWGIAGAFIAVPFLVALRSACRRSRSLRIWCVYLDRGRSEPASMRRLLGLKRRVHLIRGRAREVR